MRTIVLDETLEIAYYAHQVLAPLGVEVTSASSFKEAVTALSDGGPAELFIVHVAGGIEASDVAEQLRRIGFRGRTLAFIKDPMDPHAVELALLPRTDCVPDLWAAARLDDLIRKAGETFLPKPASPASAGTFHGMVGRSKQMLETFSRIEKVATGDANVCIYGESGTGKELIARAIHYSSARRNRPLITLDCAAVPEGLLESHLFGHVKGAYTGAVDHREGVFSLAHTGTLFIDELCQLSVPLQARLLRVIQTREFLKVGGTRPTRIDIRLITATNKDLKREVEQRAFREDLYYRVAVVMIRVPPLRERREDIPLLVEHFLRRFSALYQKPIRGVNPSAMSRIMAFHWPGNVRQLEHFLEQAVVLADGEVFGEADLPLDEYLAPLPDLPAVAPLEPALPLRELERRYILRTLQRVRGNRTQAARLLGISLRCLQYKLKAYLQGTDEQITRTGPTAKMA